MVEIVGCEAPHVHRNGRVVGNAHPLALLVFIFDGCAVAFNLGALHNRCEIALRVGCTHTTCHSAVVAQRVAYAETHHGIAVAAALGQRTEEFAHHHEAVAVVEIVAVDNAERLLNHILGHEHGVVGAPGFLATFGNTETFGQCINALKNQFGRNMPFIFRQHLLTKLVFKVFANDEHNLAKSCLNGIVNRIIHDGFAVRT